jgi:D-threo-aldose 1-dehydrogenase
VLKISAEQYRPFGRTGLTVPPLAFGARPLGSEGRPIADSTKLALCGEWFRHCDAPVLIDTCAQCGRKEGLQSLRRVLESLEVSAKEVLLCHTLSGSTPRGGTSSLDEREVRRWWNRDCQLLGEAYHPRVVALAIPDANLQAHESASRRERDIAQLRQAFGLLREMKDSGEIAAAGLAGREWRFLREVSMTVRPDWVRLQNCLTLSDHPAELLTFLDHLAAEHVPVVCAGVLPGFNNRIAEAVDSPQVIAWRRSFIALCQGYGFSPIHVAIRFALRAPAVAAVAVNTSQPGRVAENVRSALEPVPEPLWESLREEGLLAFGT